MSSVAVPFRNAYIIDRRSDFIWFLTLPFLAVAAGLLSNRYLPGAALAAIALWVTVPHHFATWLRVYGSPAEFSRWRDCFIVGPVMLVLMAYLAMRYAPLSLILVVTLWDHQHSLMQQYGFSRIYDFKAKAGAAITGRFDLAFNWIFFVNMLVVSPCGRPRRTATSKADRRPGRTAPLLPDRIADPQTGLESHSPSHPSPALRFGEFQQDDSR